MMAKKRAKVYIPASEDEFKRLGSEIMGRDPEGRSEKVFSRRWNSFFGVELVVVAETWERLRVPADDGTDLDYAKPEHLLWALLFLKKYGDEEEMAKLVGPDGKAVDEKTFRKWIKIFVNRISYLLLDVVSVCRRVCSGRTRRIRSLLSLLFFLGADHLGESEGR